MDIVKLAVTYSFKGKDKLVLGLNYFSLFCICLTIATLIVVLTVTNGFMDTVSSKIFQGLYAGDDYKVNLIVSPKLEHAKKEDKDPLSGLKKLNEVNYEVVVPQQIKQLLAAKKIEFQVAMGRSFVDVGKNKTAENKLSYMTTPDSSVEYGKIQLCISGLWSDPQRLLNFQLASVDSINPLTGLPRFKNFTPENIIQINQAQVSPVGGPCIARINPKMYAQLFEGKTAYLQTYQILDLWQTPQITQVIEEANPDLMVASWVISPHFFSAMELQRKIISVVYLMIITLVGALVLSVNISFYKDRRKDWALIEMLNISSHSVEKILALRAFIMFIVCCIVGNLLGVFISVKINSILELIGFSAQQTSNVLFGVNELSATFLLRDFILVNGVVFLAYVVTYLVQLWAYKTNSPAVLLKQGA